MHEGDKRMRIQTTWCHSHSCGRLCPPICIH